MKLTRAESHARAGLIGNPSDGFGGRTIGLLVRNFAARVVVYEWPQLEVLPALGDRCRFDTLSDFRADVAANGYDGGLRLVKAAINRFATRCEKHGATLARSFSVRYESDVPRQVGLAGSSAIVIATLRALSGFHGLQLPEVELAELALAVETEELGMPAGPQDRVVQALGGLVYMDFDPRLVADHGHGHYERLDPALLPDLYLAYRQDAAERSAVFHGDVRARHARGDRAVARAMRRLAELALEARECLLAGDARRLAELIDLGFEQRRSIYDLDPRHVRMVTVARELGASATFAGSGGAIVGTCEGEPMRAALRDALAGEGCTVIRPVV